MKDGCLAKVNSSETFNYTTYTKLRTLQTFTIETLQVFVMKKRTLQTFVMEKCGHYK